LARVTAHDTDWDGVRVPEGTQLLIVNTFNHRDRDAVEFADRFDPEQWLSGDAGGDWQFNHFSHGPQGCPGAGLSLLVGQAMLGTVVRERIVRLEQPGLDPDKPVPHMLDFFALKFELSPPA
jgi:cytochrome P450